MRWARSKTRSLDLPQAATLRHTLDELDQEGLARCALGPLGREDTQVLARSLVPSSEAAPLDEQLWRASEGNPFMVVETVRALRGGQAPEGTPALPIPERVRKLVAHRIERLGDRGRRLAAVIGRPFEWALLERAADLDATRPPKAWKSWCVIGSCTSSCRAPWTC